MPLTASPTQKLSDIIQFFTEESDSFHVSNRISLTANGRTALYLSLQLLSQGKAKKWLIPSYGCLSFFQTIRDANVAYELYPLNKALQPDFDFLKERLLQGDIEGLLVVHYFGFKTNLEPLKPLLAERGITLIEDCAHLPISPDLSIPSMEGEAQVYSLRKWFPVPHGGALVLKSPQAINGKGFSSGLARLVFKFLLYRMEGFLGLNLRNRLLSSIRIAQFLEQRDAKNNRYDQFADFKLSAFLRNRLPSLFMIRNQQRENYAILSEIFKGHKRLSPLQPILEEEICPYTYPLLTEPAERDRVYKKCLRKGIPLRIYWRFLPQEVLEDSRFKTTNSLAERILCLPVHYQLKPEEVRAIGYQVATCD